MENRDSDGNITFYFDNIFIFKIISKCITSSNPSRRNAYAWKEI